MQESGFKPIGARILTGMAAILRWAAAALGLVATIGFIFTFYGPAILVFGIAVALGAAARELQTNVNRAANRRRTAEALQTLHSITEMRPIKPYLLYLRPFYSDEILIENPLRSVSPFRPSFYEPKLVTWEAVLADTLPDYDRLIALGTPSDMSGAARISVPEDHWLRTFAVLATFADAIFIWPSTKAGTKFETEWLVANGLINKCIFCTPKHFERVVGRVGEYWLSVRAALLSLGFEMPLEPGMAFTVKPFRQMPIPPRKRQSRDDFHALIASVRYAWTPDVGKRQAAYEAALKTLHRYRRYKPNPTLLSV